MKNKIKRTQNTLDSKAIWAENEKWWNANLGADWEEQRMAIERIVNKHVRKLLKQT